MSLSVLEYGLYLEELVANSLLAASDSNLQGVSRQAAKETDSELRSLAALSPCGMQQTIASWCLSIKLNCIATRFPSKDGLCCCPKFVKHSFGEPVKACDSKGRFTQLTPDLDPQAVQE